MNIRNCWVLVVVVCLLSHYGCHAETTKEERLSNAELLSSFKNPDNQWRGKPFWAWNAKLEKKELLRQVDLLKEMGFGGYFMHSRIGLDTEYLGDEWFELTNEVADYGEKLGLQNFLYDEDRWPSGTAGGYVTQNKEFRANYISMYQVSPSDFVWNDTIVAAFACRLDGLNFSDLIRLNKGSSLKKMKANSVLVFTKEMAANTDFVNGYSYVDAMNKKATNKYIELTHEAYKKNCGDRIGNSIVGIFTDEPHRGPLFTEFGNDNANRPNMVPWTSTFVDEYRRKFGEDIIDQLPYLFLKPNGEQFHKVKWQYCELSQELFLRNFMKPIYDWCTDNNMVLTGHVLHEDNFSAQVAMQGSMMRAYEFMHYPGVDVLTQHNRNYWIVKQLSSSARQLGKKWLLSELYGCSGWQMSFDDYKESGDWQALFGINLRCPHLSWYSMKGEAKRDYPASISFQSGWYKEYKAVEDYYARIGLMLAQGTPVCDLLVLNPIETVFAEVSVGAFTHLGPKDPDIQKREQRYADLFGWIQGAQIDFDYGDEEMMSRLASVEVDEQGTPVLRVGKSVYKSVLVSNMVTIRSSTLKLLADFIKKGGKVISAGEVPSMLDVKLSDQPKNILKKGINVALEKKALVDVLNRVVQSKVKIVDAQTGAPIEDIYCQIREDGDRLFYMFMNMSRAKSFPKVKVSIQGVGSVSEWNCRDGKTYACSSTENQGMKEINMSFAPIEEHLIVLSHEAIPVTERDELEKGTPVKMNATSFSYELNEPNVYPLDMVQYSIDGGAFSELKEILTADREIRSHYGVKYRGGTMLQPWFAAKFKAESSKVLGTVTLRYRFEVDYLPEQGVELVVEDPQNYKFKLNGKEFSYESSKLWWIDPCFSRMKLDRSLLKKGVNELLMTIEYADNKNLESSYLLGEFGVSLRSGQSPLIVKLPSSLKIGDVVYQGLPFYSGVVSYKIVPEKSVSSKKRVLMVVDEVAGACVKMRCGNKQEVLPFAPFKTDCSSWLNAKDPIYIDVVLSRRNTFGPLHLTPVLAGAYGPDHFVLGGSSFTKDYGLIQNGLIKAPYWWVME